MKVDLLIRRAQVFNAYLKKFVLADVAIWQGKFLYIGDCMPAGLEAAEVLDAEGRYMIPGLIDIHMHIESSMVAPRTFSQALCANGVTTVVAEPHEIANVFGLEGIRALAAASRDCPLDVFLAIPSSVPATLPALETSGCKIEMAELESLLELERVICLGEVMNYVDVIHNPHSKSNEFLKYMKKHRPLFALEGHCPRLSGLELALFLHAGVDSDHTQQTLAGMEERIGAGMFVEIQEKSLTAEIVAALCENETWQEHVCLVTDDRMPNTLLTQGHLNALVKKSLSLGFSLEQAIYLASYTPARRIGFRDRGSIAPGKIADFSLLRPDTAFEMDCTFKNGRKFCLAPEERETSFPAHFYQSVKLSPITEDLFTVTCGGEDRLAEVRVMKVVFGTTFTTECIEKVKVRQGILAWEETPYCLAAVKERHGHHGQTGYGLVSGDCLKQGAVATTYAHDSHNLLIVGKNARDMALAANEVIRRQGGYAVVNQGEILAVAELPIAGILSDKPLPELAAEMEAVVGALQKLGYEHSHLLMSLSTLSLPVSPELKLSDQGLIAVNEQKIVPLIVK